jgi:hypothetical protein
MISALTPPLEIVLPITLEGLTVRLEPIRREHATLFWDVAKDSLDNIFQWIPYRMQMREDFDRLIRKCSRSKNVASLLPSQPSNAIPAA